MNNLFYGKDVISVKDFNLDQIEQVLKLAAKMKQENFSTYLQNKIIANCFFEPSTRTRLSFESAAYRLGAKVIGFDSDDSISTQKGESLHDTMRVISDYADLAIIRHPKEGAARLAADICTIPVINAGDGTNQHPSQTLIDLFSIQESQQRLNGLSIALVGDLKYGRAIQSFAQACAQFDIRLFFVAPETLLPPESLSDCLKKQGIRFSYHPNLQDIISKVDIVYMSRIQQERLSYGKHQAFNKDFILSKALLNQAKTNMKVLHPLPRINEIEMAVDETAHAYYFQQSANGIFVRQALLALLLREDLP